MALLLEMCFVMFWDGQADKGRCAAGDGHAAYGFNFGLPHDNPANTGQPNWRFCGKCRTLFFDDPNNPNKGRCPAGAGHVRSAISSCRSCKSRCRRFRPRVRSDRRSSTMHAPISASASTATAASTQPPAPRHRASARTSSQSALAFVHAKPPNF
jgi:hypothetical protein